jgi:hypothetical protein
VALLEEVSSRLGTAGAASYIAVAARGTGAGRMSAEATQTTARWPPGQLGGAGPQSRGHCVVRSRMDQQQRRRAEGACGPGANTYARPAARRRAFRCVSLFGEGMFDRLKQIKVELNSEISQNKSCRPRIRLQL